MSSPSIVIVSSLAHENGKMNWDDINWENSYDEWKAYSQSKLANVLHGVELAKKLENTGISVYSLHPGNCNNFIVLACYIFHFYYHDVCSCFSRRDRHRAGSPHAGKVVLPDNLSGHARVHQDPSAGGADSALLLPRGIHRRSQWQVCSTMYIIPGLE